MMRDTEISNEHFGNVKFFDDPSFMFKFNIKPGSPNASEYMYTLYNI